MIVMKFGGTSVGSAERIRSLAEIIQPRLARKPVVVVSAMTKVTDMLINGARLALARSPEAMTLAYDVEKKHR